MTIGASSHRGSTTRDDVAWRAVRQDGEAKSPATTPPDPLGRFFAKVAQRPDHPAVILGDAVTSYAGLSAMARRLATRLTDAGAERVLIALPQGPQAYAAMIGTLMSGATYIPVNVAAPLDKLRSLAQTVKPDVIVAEGALAADLRAASTTSLIIDPGDLADVDMLRGPGRRHATAYMIMTSGSTGVPKGVVISSAALTHYLDWLSNIALFRATDRVSQFPSISFDLSVLDIFGALSAGATLVPPAAPSDRWFPADFVRRSGISVWVSVPSAIDLVITGRQATADMLRSVRLFAFCGEPLRPTHLTAIFQACPAAVVMNLYGPTEATVSMTSLLLRTDTWRRACAASVALGDPIDGMGLHLIGGAHPDEGEIVITGPQLATEYWCDPVRTARAFRSICIDGHPLRAYFTGDWGERIGRHVHFKGRIDSQLKINGYRVESGEVLARLADQGWPVACVVKHRDVLTAVVEAVDDQPLDEATLRARLHAVLEPHAVPVAIHGIARMPRNNNEKLDEAAVRAWLEQLA